ncbi:MAG: hypothetical protein R8K48_07245 [Gallionella sp.]
MTTLTMNMSSFEIEHSESIKDDVLCLGWNPDLALYPHAEHKETMPIDMMPLDAEAFLNRMYTYQQ